MVSKVYSLDGNKVDPRPNQTRPVGTPRQNGDTRAVFQYMSMI